MNWKPLHMIVSTSTGKPILDAAGLENCKDIITATPYKRAGSAAFADDPGVVEYKAFMKKYLPTRTRRTRSASSPTRGQ